jgi:hypothetical protein
LVDFHAVRARKSLLWRQRVENLAILNLFFFRRSTRHDRLRFLVEYLFAGNEEERQRGTLFLYGAAQRIERRTRRKALAFWRKREKRCLGENRYFQRLKEGAYRGNAVSGFSSLGLLGYLREKASLKTKPGMEVIKDSRTASSYFWKAGEEEYFIKAYNWKKTLNPLWDVFRGSRAKRAWKKAYALTMRGIPTASPILFLERKTFLLLPLEGVLVTKKLGGFTDLLQWCAGKGELYEKPSLRQKAVSSAAGLLRLLHEEGFRHRDLKAGNLMVRAGEGEATLIDLDGLRYMGEVPWKRRRKDLARLHRSLLESGLRAVDCVRFLKFYLGGRYRLEKRKFLG